MDRAQLWALFMHAALQGYTSVEDSSQWNLGNSADVANVAAGRADAAMAEYDKRFPQQKGA